MFPHLTTSSAAEFNYSKSRSFATLASSRRLAAEGDDGLPSRGPDPSWMRLQGHRSVDCHRLRPIQPALLAFAAAQEISDCWRTGCNPSCSAALSFLARCVRVVGGASWSEESLVLAASFERSG